eukprot:15268155-Alexandrium_andersonii.AAC.1
MLNGLLEPVDGHGESGREPAGGLDAASVHQVPGAGKVLHELVAVGRAHGPQRIVAGPEEEPLVPEVGLSA